MSFFPFFFLFIYFPCGASVLHQKLHPVSGQFFLQMPALYIFYLQIG